MPKIKVRVVDCYIFSQAGKDVHYLLLKRNKNRLYEHLWQGVAGKIEKDETAWQAGIRELKEETSLKPFRMFAVDHISTFYESHQDRVNLVPVFGIEVKDRKVILSEEHIDYEWLSFRDAYERLPWNGQKKGLSIVNDMITLTDDERLRWSEIQLTKDNK